MGLHDVLVAIRDRCGVLPGIDQATISPPPQLPDDRMIIVSPLPGRGTPYAHASASGLPVVSYQDQVIVEAHWKIAADQIGAAIDWALPLLDDVRNAIWQGYHVDDLNGSVTTVDAINTERFGGLGWGTDQTFGFILRIELTHADEVTT